MTGQGAKQEKIKVGLRQAIKILAPYVKNKILEQVRSVALIITYLLFFQTIVLRMPIEQAALIAVGLALVIGGLTLFMEGLILGLMPLGELIGLKLPQKSNVWVILIFAFILGIGVTLAEPAIGVLKTAGESVKPWDAPLLFVMLNRFPHYLVYAVGIGVGIAVLFGMLRYLYNWSLKPFIYVLVLALVIVSGWAYLDPNLSTITGLAWDCGAVTTGPVTVPLVLALGIGVCRVVRGEGTGSSGFGIVTLASLFPIITVFALGVALKNDVPSPMSRDEFYLPENQKRINALFENRSELVGYTFKNLGELLQESLFKGGREEMLAFLMSISADESRRKEVFGLDPESLERWVVTKGTRDQQLAVLGNDEKIKAVQRKYDTPTVSPGVVELAFRNTRIASQAIIPLVAFLLLVLLLLRERLPRADEIFLGVLFALIGMTLFNIGIEIGLAKLGGQVGWRLPSSFQAVALPDQKKKIENFDLGMVQTAIDQKGTPHRFFFLQDGNQIEALPYDGNNYDSHDREYVHIPRKGPIYGGESRFLGLLVVLLFAFVMGYGATLAEPALNALGIAVEDITVGTFRKPLLMHAVAFGVGAGITLGVLKIIYGVPLFWLIGPPYLLLVLLTKFSTEEFVNIGWDSAGVTTGPVTVPLVLAMGLGIGNQIGVVEGFGILASASVCPILSVLLIGLRVNRMKEAALAKTA
jgi:hypothetical protein